MHGAFRHHHLDHRDVLAFQHRFGHVAAGDLQLERANQLVERFRRRLDHQEIAFAHGMVRRAMPGSRWPSRIRPMIDASLSSAASSRSRTGLADGFRVLGYRELGDIVLEIEQFLTGVCSLRELRNKPPADQGNEHHADHSADDADRGKIEHAVGFAQRSAAKLCDHDVGRGADQGDHATEN